MSAQFNILAADPAAVDCLQRSCSLPRFVAATLVARGITDPDEARRFLAPSLDRDWENPYLIPGLSEVADAVEEAVKAGKHIVVFGDFDLDGISAAATLTRGLRALGAQATPFIPLRFEEGYGLTLAAFERMRALDPGFIVTVDCGIASKHEAAAIRQTGIGIAVTDHHEPVDLVPENIPVADPKFDPECPSAVLAGVGVALKLVDALGARLGKPHLWRSFTDLAALGTVADLMPMRGENRALVAEGLARMNEQPRPCIAALAAQAGSADKPHTATNMSFSIIPRLNAAGRMGDAGAALDLLMTDDYEEACRKAGALEEINDRRRTIEAELSEIAKAQAAEVYCGQRALVVSGEGWHEGVKGIVASRLVGIYGVPVMLFTIEEGQARGSGRSVGSVNLLKAVEGTSDLLTRFGGHEAAVGVTLPAENLPAFTARLCAALDKLPEDMFHPQVVIDAEVGLSEMTLADVAALEQVAPFGQENTVPKFLARNVTIESCRAVGAEKNHFSCTLSDGKSSVSGIMFHCPDIDALTHLDSVVNAAFEIQVDEWRGRKSVKALLTSLAPARACAGLAACLNPETVNFVGDLYEASDAEICAGRQEGAEEVGAYEAACDKNRPYWEAQAAEHPEKLCAAITHALLGAKALHASQAEVLDALGEGRSTLAVMATGRGKSLIFQIHAVREALINNTASLFIYPLRALIADQAFHMTDAFKAFGVRTAVLTGENTPEERRQTFSDLAQKKCDIVLTTPEFFAFHADAFARPARIGFVVVDEAHHIGLAKAGQRVAYATIATAISALGSPLVLALTATASAPIADAITSTLGIAHRVLDKTERPNLALDDHRNLKNRESYLANLIAQGDKTVIYVNSREQSVILARALRRQVPQVAPLVGFYNAGLSRAERKRIEELFRTDALSVLVATSAFGEGVDIANIRHVVLYHLPFNAIEFNQMSGRAGRDGQAASIHLLFGRADASINERILQGMTPDHGVLAQVYRTLRTMQRTHGDQAFNISDAEIAQAADAAGHQGIGASAVACGIAVFRELGLIETCVSWSAGEATRSVRVCEAGGKVELTDSVRYREGLDERQIFQSFCEWAIKGESAELRAQIIRPILPVAQEQK